MPLYEYLCKKCGHKTELIQSHGSRPLRTCPDCGGSVKKMISAPAIQFKGSGFYITDYGKGDIGGSSKKGDGGSEKSSGGGSEGDSSSGKSDAKADSSAKSDSSPKSESSSPSSSASSARSDSSTGSDSSSRSDSGSKRGSSGKPDGKKPGKKKV